MKAWFGGASRVVAALLTCTGLVGCQGPAAEALPAVCSARSSAQIGGPFSLTDQNGRTVTEADFANGPSLFYFGYTFCPDVCPLSLAKLKLVMDALGPEAAKIKVVFVTVDPMRDTPESLKAYAANPAFPAGLITLTGNEEQVKQTLTTFRVAAQVKYDEKHTTVTEVSHASLIYLMDQITVDQAAADGGQGTKWGLSSFFPDSTSVNDIAVCLKAALAARP